MSRYHAFLDQHTSFSLHFYIISDIFTIFVLYIIFFFVMYKNEILFGLYINFPLFTFKYLFFLKNYEDGIKCFWTGFHEPVNEKLIL